MWCIGMSDQRDIGLTLWDNRTDRSLSAWRQPVFDYLSLEHDPLRFFLHLGL
jgi:hypothetical protein